MYKEPVCIPCGHVYCRKCLQDHVNVATNTTMKAQCPDCRASFELLTPDPNCLPQKYQQYVLPAVRRVYLDTTPYTNLQKKLKHAENRNKALRESEEELIKQCERYQAAASAHRRGEANAIAELDDLRNEFEEAVGALDREKEELQDTVESCEREKEELAETNEEQESEIERLNETINTLSLEKNETRAKYENLKREYRKLRAQYQPRNDEGSSRLEHSFDRSDAGPSPIVWRRVIRPLPRTSVAAKISRSPSPLPHFNTKRPRLSDSTRMRRE